MIQISKTDFERYVPVATQPEDSTEVFAMMQHGLLAAWMQARNEILGTVIANQLEDGTIAESSELMSDVKALVCMKAFANAVRRNDLILTPTGFGIVSTDKVAPASKDRVNAMLDELWQNIYDTRDSLVDALVGNADWYDSIQAEQVVATVFCHISDYKRYGADHEQYYIGTDPKVRAANHILIQHISKEFNAELLTAIRRGTVTDAQLTVIEQMKRFIGGNLAQNKYAARSAYEDLLGTLDANLETYTTYANSEAYKLNHFTHYANAADDPCYFFG